MTTSVASTSNASLAPPATPDGSAPPPPPPGVQAPSTSSSVEADAKNVGSNVIQWVKAHESIVEVGGLALGGGVAGFFALGPMGAVGGAAAGATAGLLLVKHQQSAAAQPVAPVQT